MSAGPLAKYARFGRHFDMLLVMLAGWWLIAVLAGPADPAGPFEPESCAQTADPVERRECVRAIFWECLNFCGFQLSAVPGLLVGGVMVVRNNPYIRVAGLLILAGIVLADYLCFEFGCEPVRERIPPPGEAAEGGSGEGAGNPGKLGTPP